MVQIIDYVAFLYNPGDIGAEYLALLGDGYRPFGREHVVSERYPGWLADAGFVHCQEQVVRIPIGSWPLYPAQKELGRHWREVILSGLEGEALAVLTRGLGWSKAEAEVLVRNLRREVATGAMGESRVGCWVCRKPS